MPTCRENYLISRGRSGRGGSLLV